MGLAVFEIGKQAFEGLSHLYEKWFDVTKAVEAYQEKAAEAAEQKLFDTASLETTRVFLDAITAQVDQLEKKKKAAGADLPAGGLLQYLQGFSGGGLGAPGYVVGQSGSTAPPFTGEDDKNLAAAKEGADKLHQRKSELEEDLERRKLKAQTAYDDAVDKGYAKIPAHENNALTEIKQRYEYQRTHVDDLVRQIKPEELNARGLTPHKVKDALVNQFDEQQKADEAAARKQASGERVNLGREVTQQLIKLQQEATESALRGEELYRQKALDAEADIKRALEEKGLSGAQIEGAMNRSAALSQ